MYCRWKNIILLLGLRTDVLYWCNNLHMSMHTHNFEDHRWHVVHASKMPLHK